ncbi:MAG TPA: hypothetical protein VFB59_01245 [Candidatus Saccharimonadales bacterium]|nr:hypothetical protein [Candidatus Saccharimonadales bacterium]
MSNILPNCYPPFGLYQGLRYDSRVQLRAVMAIAQANIIGYCTKEGLDQDLVTPRPMLGITFTSQKDSASVTGRLLTDAFDLQAFHEMINTLPMPEIPVYLTNPCIPYKASPKSMGMKLEYLSVGVLKRQADVARLAAHEVRGFALPVRSRFPHINLFYCGTSERRPRLTPKQKEKLRAIIGDARAEVGIRQVYLGKLVVGSEIDSPLPPDIFASPSG